jgi:hypothetical protein
MIYLDLGLLAIHVLNGIMFRRNKQYKWSNLSWFFAGWQLAMLLQHLGQMVL